MLTADMDATRGCEASKSLPGPLNGKFIYKRNGDGTINKNTVICSFCKIEFSYHRSCSSLTYHLNAKHVGTSSTGSGDSASVSSLRQRTLTECGKRLSKATTDKLTNSVAKWIAADCRPVSIVEDQGLQEAFQIASSDTHFQLPSRTTVMKRIHQLYDNERTAKAELLAGACNVALTGDHWTSVPQHLCLNNCCTLPEDFRDFYLTTDGLTLTWSVKLDNEPVPVGCMVVNSLAKLKPLSQASSLFSLPSAPTLADLDYGEVETEEPDCGVAKPSIDSRSRIFELDPCNGNGKVCLVYKDCEQGVVAQQCDVWFLDHALYWHYMTPTFTAYYRLMITHLGLPEWQYSFTPYGLSPQAKQWAALYQPITFHCDPNAADAAGEPHINKLDPIRAFKGKAKPPAPKKKQSTQGGVGGTTGTSTKSQGSSGRHSGAKR